MGIIAFNVFDTGLVGENVNPRRCTMVTTDDLATITTAGYLNNQNLLGNPILPTDKFEIWYGYVNAKNPGTFGEFTLSYSSSTGYTLVAWNNPANVHLPVTAGHVAIFYNTAGVIEDGGLLGAAAFKGVTNSGANNVASYSGSAPTAAGNFAKLDAFGAVTDGGAILRATQLVFDGTSPVTVTATGMTASSYAFCSLTTTGTPQAITNIAPGTNQVVVTLAGNTGDASSKMSVFWVEGGNF